MIGFLLPFFLCLPISTYANEQKIKNTTITTHIIDTSTSNYVRAAICTRYDDCLNKYNTTIVDNSTKYTSIINILMEQKQTLVVTNTTFLNISCVDQTTDIITLTFDHSLVNKKGLISIYNDTDFTCIDWNSTSSNVTTMKLVEIKTFLNLSQIVIQMFMALLLTACLSVCSTASRRKENRSIHSMPRGDTMFSKSRTNPLKKEQIKSLTAESARPASLDNSFPHSKRPDNWKHLGWTTPHSVSKPFQYRTIIQQSHTYIESFCGTLSYIPIKKVNETTREYLLEIVCNKHGDGKVNTTLHGNMKTFCRMHEQATFGSSDFDHDDWYHFRDVYNYILNQLRLLKKEDDKARRVLLQEQQMELERVDQGVQVDNNMKSGRRKSRRSSSVHLKKNEVGVATQRRSFSMKNLLELQQ